MEESSRRAEAIKGDAREMWSRMQENLSKEDVLGIAEGRWLARRVASPRPPSRSLLFFVNMLMIAAVSPPHFP